MVLKPPKEVTVDVEKDTDETLRSTGGSSNKTRTPRKRMAGAHLKSLEQQFLDNPMPSSQRIAELASQMGESVARITNWFNNRRSKIRREERNSIGGDGLDGPSTPSVVKAVELTVSGQGGQDVTVTKIPRPLGPRTAYTFFTLANRNAVKEKLEDKSAPAIQKKLADIWKSSPADFRRPYEERATQDKERYEREWAAVQAAEQQQQQMQLQQLNQHLMQASPHSSAGSDGPSDFVSGEVPTSLQQLQQQQLQQQQLQQQQLQQQQSLDMVFPRSFSVQATPSQSFAQDLSFGVPQELSHDISQELQHGLSQNLGTGLAQDCPGDLPMEIPVNVARDYSNGMSIDGSIQQQPVMHQDPAIRTILEQSFQVGQQENFENANNNWNGMPIQGNSAMFKSSSPTSPKSIVFNSPMVTIPSGSVSGPQSAPASLYQSGGHFNGANPLLPPLCLEPGRMDLSNFPPADDPTSPLQEMQQHAQQVPPRPMPEPLVNANYHMTMTFKESDDSEEESDSMNDLIAVSAPASTDVRTGSVSSSLKRGLNAMDISNAPAIDPSMFGLQLEPVDDEKWNLPDDPFNFSSQAEMSPSKRTNLGNGYIEDQFLTGTELSLVASMCRVTSVRTEKTVGRCWSDYFQHKSSYAWYVEGKESREGREMLNSRIGTLGARIECFDETLFAPNQLIERACAGLRMTDEDISALGQAIAMNQASDKGKGKGRSHEQISSIIDKLTCLAAVAKLEAEAMYTNNESPRELMSSVPDSLNSLNSFESGPNSFDSAATMFASEPVLKANEHAATMTENALQLPAKQNHAALAKMVSALFGVTLATWVQCDHHRKERPDMAQYWHEQSVPVIRKAWRVLFSDDDPMLEADIRSWLTECLTLVGSVSDIPVLE